MATAPTSLLHLHAALDARADKPRSYQLGGIVGDASHMNPPEGYHVSARDMHFNWSTYGLNTPRDKAGGQAYPDYASAWDLTMNDADMRLVTGRLITAAKAGDKRITAVIREIAGTTNSTTVHTFYTDTGQESTDNRQWAISHLHHVHLSFLRDTVVDYTKIAGVVDVICGRRGGKFYMSDQADFDKLMLGFLSNKNNADVLAHAILNCEVQADDGTKTTFSRFVTNDYVLDREQTKAEKAETKP